MTTPLVAASVNRSRSRCNIHVIAVVVACFAFSHMPKVFATDTGTQNVALGSGALCDNTTGNNNTALGFEALEANTSGNANTAIGNTALYDNTTGSNNTATGYGALYTNTTSGGNTAVGRKALYFSTGTNNIAIGDSAGGNLTTGDNNIDIGNTAVAAEGNTIRVGVQGTQSATYIAGISGTVITGSAVYVNSSGQLGVVTSSARFKQDIRSMDLASETILALRPVTFRYKEEVDRQGLPQFGLLAEEVEKVNPDLVLHDGDGRPYSVRYEAVNAMLLNEFLKEHRKVEKQQAAISELKSTVTQQQTTFQTKLADQERRIEALTSSLQRVTAQIALSKPQRQIAGQ